MTQDEKYLICEWFGHLEQLADDHKTQNGFVMETDHCFAEMKCLARNSKHFVEEFYNDPTAFIVDEERKKAAEERKKTIAERAKKYVKSNFGRIAEDMHISQGMETIYVESATEQHEIDNGNKEKVEKYLNILSNVAQKLMSGQLHSGNVAHDAPTKGYTIQNCVEAIRKELGIEV